MFSSAGSFIIKKTAYIVFVRCKLSVFYLAAALAKVKPIKKEDFRHQSLHFSQALMRKSSSIVN